MYSPSAACLLQFAAKIDLSVAAESAVQAGGGLIFHLGKAPAAGYNFSPAWQFIMEKSHRGLVRPLGKRIRETVRGFESHLLRFKQRHAIIRMPPPRRLAVSHIPPIRRVWMIELSE